MKFPFKTLLSGMVIFFLFPSAGYTASDTESSSANNNYQIQQTQTRLDGLIYVLYVQGPERFFTPTFEFEAGNSLIVTGASNKYGVLKGTWQEAPLGSFSYFQTQVIDESKTTTTTTPVPTPLNTLRVQPEQSEKTKFLINLWGISYSSLPPPFTNFSMLIGAGAYLRANVVFIGFSGRTGIPQCSSINPNSGSQGETNLQIDLVGTDTFFVQGETEVSFSGEGIRVSGVTVLNTTKISFNIAIDEFALTGTRDVIVTYPGVSAVCNQAFTVNPKGTVSTTTP